MQEDQITDTTPVAEPVAPAAEPTPTSGYANAKEAMEAVYTGTYQTPSPAPEPVNPEPTPTPEATTPAEPAPSLRLTPAEEAPKPASVAWPEVTGGLVKDQEELQSALQEWKTLKENPVAALSPSEQKLLQLHRGGMDFTEYLQFQHTDFDKMDAEQILRFQFDQENKGIPKQFADRKWEKYLKTNYPNLEAFGDNDADSELDKWQLSQDAQNAKQKLLARKSEMSIPAPEPASAKEPAAPAQVDPQLLAEYQRQVQQATSAESISVDVQDGNEKRTVQLPIARTPEFTKAVETPGDFLVQRWTNADGSTNVQQVAVDMAAIFNAQQWSQTAFQKGKETGSTQIKQVLENPEPLAPMAQPSSEPDRSGLLAEIKRATRNQTRVVSGGSSNHVMADY